jgi:hypothetical protein
MQALGTARSPLLGCSCLGAPELSSMPEEGGRRKEGDNSTCTNGVSIGGLSVLIPSGPRVIKHVIGPSVRDQMYQSSHPARDAL